MILHADARTLPLRAGCVDCVVTSPPYWGLRDYGHAGQLGLEPTPEAYVAALVGVFREVARVLKPAGTVWLNLGDSYANAGGVSQPHRNSNGGFSGSDGRRTQRYALAAGGFCRPSTNAKPKDLVGIPWRVAFALQADGWYLRSDIIWHKPNPMPESVTDRPTKAHEYVFLLTRSERYHYDAAAIAEATTCPEGPGNTHPYVVAGERPGPNANKGGSMHLIGPRDVRNKRSVWTIPTLAYSGAHFATMPEALVEPCILAGCPLGGLVLDPFLGSGTVGAVAERLGRRWVGCDLAYHDLSAERTAQRGLRFELAIS